MHLRARGSGFGTHLHMRTQERASEKETEGDIWHANENVCSSLKNRCVICGVVFMFVGRSVKEVWPLTVMHINTMHHVMSTHFVTVCPDPAVNSGYPGNQVVGGLHHWFHQGLWEGKKAHGEALFRNDSDEKQARLKDTKRKKKKLFVVRTLPNESGSAKTRLHLRLRTLFIW